MYYKTIKNLTVKRWILAQGGDLKALRVFRLIGTRKGDEKAIESVLNSYIDIFGFGSDYETIWNKKKELASLIIEYLKDFDKNRWMLMDIDILNEEIRKIESKQGKPLLFIDLVANLKNNGSMILDTDTVYMVEKMVRNEQRG